VASGTPRAARATAPATGNSQDLTLPMTNPVPLAGENRHTSHQGMKNGWQKPLSQDSVAKIAGRPWVSAASGPAGSGRVAPEGKTGLIQGPGGQIREGVPEPAQRDRR